MLDIIEQALESQSFKRSFSIRRDANMAHAVNHGIALQALDGTTCAIEYMKHAGVRADVIVRVLGQPHARRRGADLLVPPETEG